MTVTRAISIIGLLFSSLGCMLGSGWLFGAHYAAKIAGPAAILSWALGGAMILFIAIAFSELSTCLPVNGGLARFTQLTHGKLVSICMSWLAWLSCVAVAPTEVQAILQYSTPYFPWLTHTVAHMPVLTLPGLIVAAILLFIISGFNLLGIQRLTRCNSMITLWKLLIPIGVVATISTTRFHPDIAGSITHGGFMPNGIHGVIWALPTAGIVFSFLGFREATSLAGEAKNPAIAIPLAVVGSVVISTLLYLFIQIGFLGALTPDMLSHGWSRLHFPHDVSPFAGLAMHLGLTFLAPLIYFDALLSPFGTGLIYTATTARLNYGMSRNGYTPQVLLGLNQKGVPVYAIGFNFIVGLLLFIPLPSWQALVSFQSVAIVLAYGTGPLSVLALRYQAPQLPRPFRVPCVTVFCWFTFYICTLIAYWAGWKIILHLLLCIALCLLFVVAYRYLHLRAIGAPQVYLQLVDELDMRQAVWLLPYFTGLGIISYLGCFGGGKQVLILGWDMLALAGLSLFCFILGLHQRLPDHRAEKHLQHIQNEVQGKEEVCI